MVAAAGSGTRFGGAKLWADLAGSPVLAWVLRALGDPASGITELVVVADPADHRRVVEVGAAVAPRLGCVCVPGGGRRQDSVRNGVEASTRDLVLVHDGARPGVTPELVARVLGAARRHGAATACLPVADATARLAGGLVEEVLERSSLGAIQTPQAFIRELLLQAHHQAAETDLTADDDAALVLAFGHAVAAVPGDPRNLKVTRTEDLMALRAWLATSDGVIR